MKTAIGHEKVKFLVITPKHESGPTVVVYHQGTPKLWGITHENGHKTQKYEFLFIPLKDIPSLAGHANRPRTPKLWAIAQQTTINRENVEFLVISLKHVAGLAGHANPR